MYSPEYVRLQLASKPSTPYRSHPASPPPNAATTPRSANKSNSRYQNRTSASDSLEHRSPIYKNYSAGGAADLESTASGSSVNGGDNVEELANGSPYSLDFQKKYFRQRHEASLQNAEGRSEERAANFYFSLQLAAEREKEFVSTKQRNAGSKAKQVYKGTGAVGTASGHKSVMSDTTGASGMLSPDALSRSGRAQNRLHLTKQKVVDRMMAEETLSGMVSGQGEGSMAVHKALMRKDMLSFGLANTTQLKKEQPPPSSALHPRSHIKHSPMVETFANTAPDGAKSAGGGGGRGGGSSKKLFLPTTEPGELFSATLAPQQKHILLACLEFITESGMMKDGSQFRQTIGWYRADVKKVLELLSSKFSEWDCLDYGSIEWNIVHNVMTEVRRTHGGSHSDVSRTSFFGSVSKRHIERVHDFLMNDVREKTKNRIKGGAQQ